MYFHNISKLHEKPGKLLLAGATIIILFFGGIGGIAAFMPFTGAVIAPGTVKISQEKKTIQHLEGGIVDEILVKQGDRVEKGQILVTLKSAMVNSMVDLLLGRLAAKQIEGARLAAQRDFRDNFSIPKNLAVFNHKIQAVVRSEKEMFTRTRASLISRMNIQAARIRQLEEKIAGTKDELDSIKEILSSFTEEINAKTPLMKERYIDKAQILTLKRMQAEQKGHRARLVQSLAESREQIQEIKLSMESLKNEFQEHAAAQLTTVNEEIFQLGQQLGPQQDAKERLALRAPVTGIVMNLRIHSEDGGVIRPGEPVLDIVPENAQLIVECNLRQDKITSVHMGQKTKVQLSAFNRVTTAPVNGKVSYISPDSVMQQMPNGVSASFYLLHVRIDPDELSENSTWLSPGMPAVCFITMEERTFFQYLAEPILLNLDHSLRETL